MQPSKSFLKYLRKFNFKKKIFKIIRKFDERLKKFVNPCFMQIKVMGYFVSRLFDATSSECEEARHMHFSTCFNMYMLFRSAFFPLRDDVQFNIAEIRNYPDNNHVHYFSISVHNIFFSHKGCIQDLLCLFVFAK